MAFPHTRLKQSVDGFILILKNTHFESLDGVLVRTAVLEELPVIIVKFPEAARDFLVVLEWEELGTEGAWLHRDSLQVTLELADAVITDQISRSEFVMSEADTSRLKEAFYAEQHLSAESLHLKLEHIDSNLHRYL